LNRGLAGTRRPFTFPRVPFLLFSFSQKKKACTPIRFFIFCIFRGGRQLPSGGGGTVNFSFGGLNRGGPAADSCLFGKNSDLWGNGVPPPGCRFFFPISAQGLTKTGLFFPGGKVHSAQANCASPRKKTHVADVGGDWDPGGGGGGGRAAKKGFQPKGNTGDARGASKRLVVFGVEQLCWGPFSDWGQALGFRDRRGGWPGAPQLGPGVIPGNEQGEQPTKTGCDYPFGFGGGFWGVVLAGEHVWAGNSLFGLGGRPPGGGGTGAEKKRGGGRRGPRRKKGGRRKGKSKKIPDVFWGRGKYKKHGGPTFPQVWSLNGGDLSFSRGFFVFLVQKIKKKNFKKKNYGFLMGAGGGQGGFRPPAPIVETGAPGPQAGNSSAFSPRLFKRIFCGKKKKKKKKKLSVFPPGKKFWGLGFQGPKQKHISAPFWFGN